MKKAAKILPLFDECATKSDIRFIDLFSGIGGIRCGFEQACRAQKLKPQCVFTSEIKPHAVEIFKQNHPNEPIFGDICEIKAEQIPEFDFLLAGFPCQAFSAAGKRLGFADTRGTLFFEVERILRAKRPFGFILENVEGLVTHDRRDPKSPIGETLQTILNSLQNLGYKTAWRVLNSKDFGVAQDRKRIYIVGTLKEMPNLDNFKKKEQKLKAILQQGLPTQKSDFIDKLLSHFSINELLGKSIKDKRGGKDNIHSWDIELKGPVSKEQKRLLNLMLKERRKKQWADDWGIKWMDGMPLNLKQISTFFHALNLQEMLDDLVAKKYLRLEHPKAVINGKREYDLSLLKGYNIVTGKMSFEINKILDPNSIAPTLVAMDMERLFVADGGGLRRLSLKEGLGLFGYPDDYKFNIDEKMGFDLLGNTVVVPAIAAVASRAVEIFLKDKR